MRHFLLRGILIGGSMGVLYALAGFSDSLPRAFGVGMIGGALAGLTLAIRQRKRKVGMIGGASNRRGKRPAREQPL